MNVPVVTVRQLDFAYGPDDPWRLRADDWQLLAGERHLLVGANGSGKTTFLRIVAGGHLMAPDAVLVLGRPAFHDTTLVRHVQWIGNPFPDTVDISVAAILAARTGTDARRRSLLLDLLDIDPGWRLHRLSAGQRRRVELLVKLLRPVDLLLLDEVTAELDVVVRADLLDFLRRESEARGTAILHATHIFDGLDDWATHLSRLEAGRLLSAKRLADIEELSALRAQGTPSPLYRLIEGWLRRSQRAKQGAELCP